jgi:hypothetical protein
MTTPRSLDSTCLHRGLPFDPVYRATRQQSTQRARAIVMQLSRCGLLYRMRAPLHRRCETRVRLSFFLALRCDIGVAKSKAQRSGAQKSLSTFREKVVLQQEERITINPPRPQRAEYRDISSRSSLALVDFPPKSTLRFLASHPTGEVC